METVRVRPINQFQIAALATVFAANNSTDMKATLQTDVGLAGLRSKKAGTLSFLSRQSDILAALQAKQENLQKSIGDILNEEKQGIITSSVSKAALNVTLKDAVKTESEIAEVKGRIRSAESKCKILDRAIQLASGAMQEACPSTERKTYYHMLKKEQQLVSLLHSKKKTGVNADELNTNLNKLRGKMRLFQSKSIA